ncbi:conserved hypothetical protein [[Clostridium] ultunense Esp]|nr:conserved hypothetical protein [[Clostridium] ultunense Esp]
MNVSRKDNREKEYTIIDAHSDIPYEVFLRRMDGERKILDTYQALRLKRGGVNIQVFAIYIEDRYKPARALELALRQIESLYSDLAESSEFMLIKNKMDLEMALKQEKIGVIIAMEGAEPIESGIDLLHLFYRLGIRILGLTWNQRNTLADGIDEINSRGGLTNYGRKVVEEAYKLGIIIDVSHLAPAGVDDVLKYATGPVIASHCGAKSVYNHPRNLSDKHIGQIAETGGVIGVPAFPMIIGDAVPTVENVVDHIMHMLRIAGDNHVGFGSDFIDYFSELVSVGRMGKEWLVPEGGDTQGLSKPENIINLINAMTKRGLSQNTIKGVMGENFLRIFNFVLPDN